MNSVDASLVSGVFSVQMVKALIYVARSHRDASPEEFAEVHRDYVAPFFPGVSDVCAKSAVCLYTCTDDTRFIVDALPGHDNVVVASPCSGHGFKHSAAIGEAIEISKR